VWPQLCARPLPYRKRRAALSQKTHFRRAKHERARRRLSQSKAQKRGPAALRQSKAEKSTSPMGFSQSKAEKSCFQVDFSRAKQKSPAAQWVLQSKAEKSCASVDFFRAKRESVPPAGFRRAKSKSPAPQWVFAEQSAKAWPGGLSQSKVGKPRRRLIENYARFYLDFRARRSDGCAAPGRWDKPPPEGGTP